MSSTTTETLEARARRLVDREVHYCVSGLVTLHAANCGRISTEGRHGSGASLLADLCDQAFELAAPIPDYESAAREAGWERGQTSWNSLNWTDGTRARVFMTNEPGSAAFRDLCEAEGIEPHDREVYEHWIVSDWFAEKLAEKGEKVDTDFAGMAVWARTTTGQAIHADAVVEAIAADLVQLQAEG